jgi:hypothetical protein
MVPSNLGSILSLLAGSHRRRRASSSNRKEEDSRLLGDDLKGATEVENGAIQSVLILRVFCSHVVEAKAANPFHSLAALQKLAHQARFCTTLAVISSGGHTTLK